MIYLKHKWKGLLASLALALAAGGVGALLSGGMGEFDSAAKPPLTPPGWVFPAVWTLLYLWHGHGGLAHMGAALRRQGAQALVAALIRRAARGERALARAVLSASGSIGPPPSGSRRCLALVVWTLLAFRRLDDLAAILMAPYALWCAFALYLNIGVAALN